MTKQETIQVLQSIEDRVIDFPNMTECDWVAITAAKRHLQEEPVSEELEKAANEWNTKASFTPFYMTLDYNGRPNGVRRSYTTHAKYFKTGAKWQKKHLWKDAQGDDLPEIDKEVIALLNNGKVVFAHRSYKGKYIGRSLTTGNIETFENETYNKGGWNQPDVKYWLDVELPKEIEI